MFELKNLLFEIGGGSLESYDFMRVRFDRVEGEYGFKTDEGWKYWVTFELVDPLNSPWAAVKVDFGVHDKQNNFETEEDRTVRVLNTVIEIAEKHIKSIDFEKYSGIKYIIFTGATKEGGESVNSKRSRIYRYFVEDRFQYDVNVKEFSFSVDEDASDGEYLTMGVN